MSFTFLDPGPMIDGDLRLVAPEAKWIDDVLRSAHHPQSMGDQSLEAPSSRQKLIDFLRAAPLGHQNGDASHGRLPAYHLWMLADPAIGEPPLRIVGAIGLRVGMTDEIRLYSGNIGYHVYPAARGNRFAERSCRLLIPLARRHGLDRLWITCNPDNLASRRTCERLGCKLIDVVPIPLNHPFRTRGETEKCRYLLEC